MIEAAFHIVGTVRHISSDADGVPEKELLSKGRKYPFVVSTDFWVNNSSIADFKLPMVSLVAQKTRIFSECHSEAPCA